MRPLLVFAILLAVATSPSCERSIATLVVYGCDDADLVLESAGVEIGRIPPGVTQKCFWPAESRVAALTSRCEGGAAIAVQRGVFNPAVECVW